MNEDKLPKAYNPQETEQKIYDQWESSGFFNPNTRNYQENKPSFTISMPPPNATGTLHLGHAVMLALEDSMIRYYRMNGHPTLWVPGTDHAAIATQSVVEAQLQKTGIKNPRTELGREKLLEEIKIFVEKSKNTIRNQVRKMGASCDWSREKYTLEDDLNIAVNEFFRLMYEDGLIYHGDRIVNWDPIMQTTVADDELEYKEETTKFYYFQYGPVIIGTARPETKFGDKVIVVNPNDERYKELHGKEVELEWINGPITAKVITDESIDQTFGSGAMTITPWHDSHDFALAQKNNIEREQIIDFENKLMPIAQEFAGMHIEEAREKIVEKLKQKGLLVKVEENYVHNVAINYRGKGKIEPQIMKQWFIDVNKKVISWKGNIRSIKEVLQDTVQSEMIRIIPDRFEKTYFSWIDNLQDWCISRQIWWGHRIPVWYRISQDDKKRLDEQKENSSFIVQKLGIKILETLYSEKEPEQPTDSTIWFQDPDTLDTWFSAALWTFSTLGWPQHGKDDQNTLNDLKRFHPTSVLETGYDILFFWVARMILASTYCLRKNGLPEENCIPFKNIYLHGMVRDREGKKMSKSRPETCINPLDMIEKYGTDAIRLSLIVGTTPGNDVRLYEEKIAGYRNFVNKLWNISRFIMLKHTDPIPYNVIRATNLETLADIWIINELDETIKKIDEEMLSFRFSNAIETLREFTWTKLADWYLEIVKVETNDKNPILNYILQTILKLWHPFAPFVTEHIWSILLNQAPDILENEKNQKMLMVQEWPDSGDYFQAQDQNVNKQKTIDEFTIIQQSITALRNARSEKKIPPAQLIPLVIRTKKYKDLCEQYNTIIKRLGRIESITFNDSTIENNTPIIIDNDLELYLLTEEKLNSEEESARIKKEIENLTQYINNLKTRLSNTEFIKNAPQSIIEKEQEKLKNAKEKKALLEKRN